jgi:site-specific DNA-methyltransferase (adenine-specific)
VKPYYEKDGITIYLGNCKDIMVGIPSKSVGLALTSPPYNMRTRVRNGEYTGREVADDFSTKYTDFEDAMTVADYYLFHSFTLKEMMRISETVLWNIQFVTGNKEAVFRVMGEFCKEIKDIITWDKGYGQPAMHENVMNKATEQILVFEENASPGREFKRSFFRRGEMDDIWRLKRGKAHEDHGAVFPLSLAVKAIYGWSNEGDIVLDPFLGTGTTMVAARETGRKGIGIEISEDYCKIAIERLAHVPMFTVTKNPVKKPSQPIIFGEVSENNDN